MQSEVITAAVNARVIFVMGAKDTGKTTLTTDLAKELFKRGYSVGVIDADIGQSDIGPPTTIGFGVVNAGMNTLRDIVEQHLYFVGSISPIGHLLPMIVGTRKMLDKALAVGMQKILINTTGLVTGRPGRVLKEHKIAMVDPDLIVCLQTNHECEPILRAYTSFKKPIIVRCLPDPRCHMKTQPTRRIHRETAFQRYFSHARDFEYALTEIGIFDSSVFRGRPVSSQQLRHLSEECRKAEMEGNTKLTHACHTICIWGELLGQELHLVTSKKLSSQQICAIKKSFRKGIYVTNYLIDGFQNLLVALLNENYECCSLGILRSIDFHTPKAVVFSHANPRNIAGLQFSTYTLETNLKASSPGLFLTYT